MSDGVPSPPASSTPQSPVTPAKKMVGPFELIEKVGQGGMGTVHRARQISLDREVALKILPPSIAKDVQFIERFQKEARASAKLSHPNIVTGIDVGQDPKTGLWYFAMEFVDGPSLKDVLRDKGVMPEADALKIMRDIASALECLHQNGMIHRDIKPDNIMLTTRGESKLADLGLAKDLKDDASMTQAGKAVGTPHYMAPEQVRGETVELDIRADIYALGGTLFHLITGKTPYTGETSAVIMAKHLTDPVPKAKDVNPEVSLSCSRLIERMMQKKKEDRVQTPKELLELIEKVKRNEFTTGPRTPIIKHTTGPRAPVGPIREGSKVPLIAAAAAGVVLIGAVAFFALSGKKDNPVANNTGKDPGKVVATNTNPENTGKTDTPANTGKGDPAETKTVIPPEVAAAKEEALKKFQNEFNEADAFAKANPDNYGDILKRLHQLNKQVKEAPGFEAISDKIDAAIADARGRRREAADAVWKTVEGNILESVAARDYDRALKFCDEVPPKFAEMLKERAAERAQALHKDAEGTVSTAVRKAEELSGSAQPEEALKALATVDNLVYSPTATALKDLKKRLETEIVNAVELKKKREALAVDKAFDAVLEKFDKAAREERNFETARQIAADAQKDAALKPAEERLKALAQVAEALDDPQQWEQKALMTLKGQTVDLQKTTGGSVKGTVKKVENGMIFVTMKQGTAEADFPVKLSDLNEASRTKLSPSFNATTDPQRIVMAIERLAPGREDIQKAEEWLNSAAGFPITAHYMEIVAHKKQSENKNAAETAAAALYGEINLRASAAKISDADKTLLQEKIGRFDAEFAQTQFAQSIADKITAIRKKLGMGAGAGTATPAGATVAAMANGDFDKGLLEPWELGRARMEITVVPTAARTGRGGLQFAGDRRGEIHQKVALEPGATYALSGWTRVQKGIANNFTVDLHVRFGGEDDDDATNFRATTPQLYVNQWIQVQTTFTAPAAATPTIDGRLQLHVRHDPGERATGEARRGIIHFDDIALVKTSGTGAKKSALGRFEIPVLLKLGGVSFWVSPKNCPGGTDRELCSNTLPVVAGAAAVVPEPDYKVLGFDGGSSLTYTLDEKTKSTSTTGTMLVWVKTKTPAAAGSIMSRCDKRYDDVSLWIHNGKLLYSVDFDAQAGVTNAKLQVYSKTNMPVDKWVMFAATWDGKNVSIYINGEKEVTQASSIVPPRRANLVTIGDNPTGVHEYMNGQVGGAMIFERNLSDGEIRGLYVLGGIR